MVTPTDLNSQKIVNTQNDHAAAHSRSSWSRNGVSSNNAKSSSMEQKIEMYGLLIASILMIMLIIFIGCVFKKSERKWARKEMVSAISLSQINKPSPQTPTKMTGTWYEVERSFHLMEISTSCTELEVTLNERHILQITVNVINRWTRRQGTSYGLGIPSHNGSSSFRYKLNNRMPYIIGRMLPGAGQYYVLYTDYDKFAIIWSCTNFSVAHSDRMWILGRQRDIEAGLRARIYTILEELKLDPDRLILSKNDNCTITPETSI